MQNKVRLHCSHCSVREDVPLSVVVGDLPVVLLLERFSGGFEEEKWPEPGSMLLAKSRLWCKPA